VNFKRKLIIVIGALSIFFILLLCSGCSFVTPNYDDYIISYIKVTPTSANMKVNISKTFTVWAYNSEGSSIPVDPSKVTWSCTYQCSACGTVWELSPHSGSVTTSFTPKKYGIYYIYAKYKGKNDDSRINAY